MDKRQVLLLVLACVIPFLFVLARGTWVGFDSYAYVSTVCVDSGISVWINSDLFRWILVNFVPCNFFVMTGLQFVAMVVVCLSWSLVGEVFEKRGILQKGLGWLVGFYAVALTPAIFILGSQFEEAFFGYALSCLGFALFWLGAYAPKLRQQLTLLFLSIIALFFSVLLWKASVLMCLALILMIGFGWIVWIIVALGLISQINYALATIYYLTSGQIIAEEAPIIGLFFIAHLLKTFKTAPKIFLWPGILLLLVGLIKIKYIFLCVPFLVLAYCVNPKPIRIIFVEIKNINLFGIVLLFIWGGCLFIFPPSIQQLELIHQGIELSHNTNQLLLNDFDYGWWITSQQKDTNFKASFPNPDYNSYQSPFLALTKLDLNCVKINTAQETKLWQC